MFKKIFLTALMILFTTCAFADHLFTIVWNSNPVSENVYEYRGYNNGSLIFSAAAPPESYLFPTGSNSFTMTAVNDMGESDPSAAVIVNVPAGIPSGVTGMAGTSTGGFADISWTANPAAEYVLEYDVYVDGVYAQTVAETQAFGLDVRTEGSHNIVAVAINIEGESMGNEVFFIDTLPGATAPTGIVVTPDPY